MAIVKFAPAGSPLNNIFDYVMRDEATEDKDSMDKEFSTITLNNPSDFYRRNLFSTTTMTVNGATYEIISVNPTADAPTVSDTIKYLINGK